ncbi:MAG: nitroreductase family deazaflavin-dependent oxidoreductase [Actinomycetota bacterium]
MAGVLDGDLGRGIARVVMALHSRLFRATGGKVGGRLPGVPVLLLTTTGRHSGKKRVTPLSYLARGDDLVLVASSGGSDRMPAWYLNLRANPTVWVQVGKQKRQMCARPATGEERAQLWPKVVELYRGYESYQLKTERRIPLVILS